MGVVRVDLSLLRHILGVLELQQMDSDPKTKEPGDRSHPKHQNKKRSKQKGMSFEDQETIQAKFGNSF